MDFDDVKENIQPLAAGRNASILQASLHVDSQKELLAQRQELERAINSYEGDDPLEAWYDYITWIEQSFPSGGKESGLEEVITKCLRSFEGNERYFQDRRMIRIYIKFIEMHKNQGATEIYKQLFNAGIGTMVADFYISWAYCYDLNGNYRKADEIFRRGIACRAEPLEELQEAQQHFGFTVSRRMLYKDDENVTESANKQLHERRLALSSLRSHRKKVGSIRTGAAIKSCVPGSLETSTASSSSSTRSSNIRVQVFSDENAKPNVPSLANPKNIVGDDLAARSKSVVSSIIEIVRDQENKKEPGPWNKPALKKKGKLFDKTSSINELGFEILEDDCANAGGAAEEKPARTETIVVEKSFKPFPNFKSRNRPLPEWITPVTLEDTPRPRTCPRYHKCKLYPRPNREYQLEELLAYNWFRKRGITNKFTQERDVVWKSYDIGPVRSYPNFAKKSRQQQQDSVQFYAPEKSPGLVVPFEQLYNSVQQVEMQNEELLAKRWKTGERKLRCDGNATVLFAIDMEETVCESYDGERIHRRKSFFPSRKSMASTSSTGRISMLSKASMPPPQIQEELPEEAEVKGQSSKNGLKVEQPNSRSPIALNTVQNAEECIDQELQKSLEGFKIFEDTEQLSATSSSRILSATASRPPGNWQKNPDGSFEENKENAQYSDAAVDHDKFDFKTPSIPVSSGKTVKIPFEIYQEESKEERNQQRPINPQHTETFIPFEADDTCSTQAFNFFIKSGSVSTPNAPHKTASRVFGTILKDRTEPEPFTDTSPSSSDYPEARIKTELALSYSPPAAPAPQKQLSTILETSEQGTNTKLSVSSPKSGEALALEAKEEMALSSKLHLRPIEEQIADAANAANCSQRYFVNQDKSHNSLLPQQQQEPASTPAITRLQKAGNEIISIFSDHNTLQQVGNFSRLEERDETNTGYIIPAVEFQEDKTETITKTIFSSKQNDNKFPDEPLTETLTKSNFATAPVAQSDQENTATSEKLPFVPPFRMSKESTETEDLFDFFTQTPPKSEKYEKLSTSSHRSMRNTVDFLNFDNKDSPASAFTAFKALRCDYNTPVPCQKQLYNDDRENNAASVINLADLSVPCSPQKNLKDNYQGKDNSMLKESFMPDISLMDNNTSGIVKNSQPYFESSSKLFQPLRAAKLSSLRLTPRVNAVAQDPLKLSDSSKVGEFIGTSNTSIIPDSQPYFESASRLLQPSKSFNTSRPAPNDCLSHPDFSMIKDSQPCTAKREEEHCAPLGIDPHEHILTDSFMKDFTITEKPSSPLPPPPPASIRKNQSKVEQSGLLEDLMRSTERRNTLKFENDFQNTSTNDNGRKTLQQTTQSAQSEMFPPLLNTNMKKGNDSFELNAETAQFALNLSRIKNSTLLTPDVKQRHTTFQENLLHKKPHECSRAEAGFEAPTELNESNKPICASKGTAVVLSSDLIHNSAHNARHSLQMKTCNEKSTLSIEKTLLDPKKLFPEQKPQPSTSLNSDAEARDDADDDNRMSIYAKYTTKTPKIERHIWNDSNEGLQKGNSFVHFEVDINETQNNIEKICLDENVNPFNSNLINSFLDQINFTNYIDELPSCMLIGKVSQLHKDSIVKVNDVQFKVQKLVGEGAYGAVFCAIESKTGRKYALKQERPPNFWEYCICLEVHARLTIDELRPAFMSVDYALIGRNASILIAPFSPYGTLIKVCNKIKKVTMKNLDEYVVMHIACQLLEIIDHLHALEIIHADIKADNFLLMEKLSHDGKAPSIQLIDFGVSIDMQCFKKGQTFRYTHKDNSRKCVEMRENRPWTYQLDLYGLAETIHVLLFGKYMDIYKTPGGFWMHKTHVPRYLNKILWETIFKTLLNVSDCSSMPNLQKLRVLLKEEIAEKENHFIQKMFEFNRALDC